MVRSRRIRLTVPLGQWFSHPVQEPLGEGCSVEATGIIHNMLAAVKILLEAAAKQTYFVWRRRICHLVFSCLDLLQIFLISVRSFLVLCLDTLHAWRMSKVVHLIRSFHTEVLNHLDCASIQHVEVGPLVPCQAPHRKAVDASQAIH